MDANDEGGIQETVEWRYKPGEGFEEDSRDPLLDLDLTNSSQLWLFQWPLNNTPDFHSREISLNLVNDGHLGSFEGSSGESYEMVSFADQGPDATVFLSSPSGNKIVGKIARRVSVVHYADPEKLEKKEIERLLKRQVQQSPSKSSSQLSATPTRSSKLKGSSLSREYSSKTHSSRTKSYLSQPGEQSKSAKRGRVH